MERTRQIQRRTESRIGRNGIIEKLKNKYKVKI